jgi:ACR3 family arsenite efflux pump ArsB
MLVYNNIQSLTCQCLFLFILELLAAEKTKHRYSERVFIFLLTPLLASVRCRSMVIDTLERKELKVIVLIEPGALEALERKVGPPA